MKTLKGQLIMRNMSCSFKKKDLREEEIFVNINANDASDFMKDKLFGFREHSMYQED